MKSLFISAKAASCSTLQRLATSLAAFFVCEICHGRDFFCEVWSNVSGIIDRAKH